MVCIWNLNWVSTLSGAEFELLEVINYNVKITASGNSGLSDDALAPANNIWLV